MKNPIKFYFLITFGILILFACNSGDIIPQKDMVKILKKIYLTDGVVNISNSQEFFDKDTIQYYEPILSQYGYTTAQFDSSIKYYTRNTEEFDEIFDRVIIELSRLEEKIKEVPSGVDSLETDADAIDTSLNLWPHKTYWDMALDHHSNPSLGFDIPVKKYGIYTISFDVQIFPDDESEDTRMYIFFYYDDKTPTGSLSKEIYHTYVKDGSVQSLSFNLELDNPTVTHISGWLYDHGGERKDLKRHAIFSKLYVSYKPVLKDSISSPRDTFKFRERKRKLLKRVEVSGNSIEK